MLRTQKMWTALKQHLNIPKEMEFVKWFEENRMG
jgi:hypothetical protein